MIPAIALMIAVYGSARLLNDGFKRHYHSNVAMVMTWVISALAIIGLWILALMMNAQSLSSSPISN